MDRPRSRASLALCLALPALAACAGDINPARDLAYAAGVTGGEPKPAPDFVTKGRSDMGDYIPVGTNAPKRVYRIKTVAEIAKDKTDMEAARTRNEQLGAAATQEAQRAAPK